MTNPYATPESTVSTAQSNAEPPRNATLHVIAIVASGLAIAVFLIAAFILLPQALRMAASDAGMPTRFQGGNQAMARASWIGGLTAVGGFIANIIALALTRRRRYALPLAICAFSVACMVIVAIAFRPA